jgi:hypothetical protein
VSTIDIRIVGTVDEDGVADISFTPGDGTGRTFNRFEGDLLADILGGIERGIESATFTTDDGPVVLR